MTSVRNEWRHLIVGMLSVCIACSACTTTRQVDVLPSLRIDQLGLEAGRKVAIVLRSGENVSGTIVAADSNSLTVRSNSGSIRGIAIEDIVSLHTSRISPGRTALAIGGAVLAAGAAVFTVLVIRAQRDSQ